MGSLKQFCIERCQDPALLVEGFKVREQEHKGRPAISFPSPIGVNRIKYLDGKKPKAGWARRGGRMAWYGLDFIGEASSVYLVNGEASVWACANVGEPAVCTLGGENGKIPDPAKLLEAGVSEVFVVYDLDDTGREGAVKAVAALREGGIQAEALELPAELGEGGDVDDLHRQVGARLGEVFAGLRRLPKPRPDGFEGLLMFNEVEPREIDWLWKERIPLGKLTIIDGDPGYGKSAFATDMAARVSRGKVMPDGTAGIQGGVLFLAEEDGLADTAVPRAEVAGADLSRIAKIGRIRDENGRRYAVTLGDLEVLEYSIREMGAKLLVIDPLTAHLPTNTDSHRDSDIRAVLSGVADIAERTGAAILVVRHFNKGTNSKAIHRGGGSIGIIAAARVGLVIAPSPADPSMRILAISKSNISELGLETPSLEFRLESAQSSVGSRPVIAWGGASEFTATDLVAEQPSGEQREHGISSERQEVLDVLSEKGGESTLIDLYTELECETKSSRGALRKLLHLMFDKGQVEKPARGTYCLPNTQSNSNKVTTDNSLQGNGLEECELLLLPGNELEPLPHILCEWPPIARYEANRLEKKEGLNRSKAIARVRAEYAKGLHQEPAS